MVNIMGAKEAWVFPDPTPANISHRSPGELLEMKPVPNNHRLRQTRADRCTVTGMGINHHSDNLFLFSRRQAV
jgi:hypothetical protein